MQRLVINTEEIMSTEPEYKLCKTVGQLIAELKKLPKSEKLCNPMRPVHYNIGESAKQIGLTPRVGFNDD